MERLQLRYFRPFCWVSVPAVQENRFLTLRAWSTVPDLGETPESGKETPRCYYVSTTGDDSASGTEDEPLRTINCALGRVAPGDTVLVRGGSYHEFVRPTVSGERGRVITLAACPGETVKIDGTGLEISGWLRALVRVEVDYMTFENLHVCHAVNAAPNSDPEGSTSAGRHVASRSAGARSTTSATRRCRTAARTGAAPMPSWWWERTTTVRSGICSSTDARSSTSVLEPASR